MDCLESPSKHSGGAGALARAFVALARATRGFGYCTAWIGREWIGRAGIAGVTAMVPL